MHREPIPGVVEVLFPRALVNAHLVDTDVLTLIDTGTPGGAGAILRALRDRGREPADVQRILLTHRHSDHAGNAAALARETGATVFAPPADAAYVRDGTEQPRPRAATRLGRAMVPYVKAALPWQVEPVAVDESLADGTTLGPFRVIATPGHTAGHVSLLFEERGGILFTGDAAARITGVGPHPAADDPATARASVAALAREDFRAACFGHGRPLTVDAAQRFREAAG
jgi:glyoxylase-like metal-dependent hydrolase (beta-lactamase superfamily II)